MWDVEGILPETFRLLRCETDGSLKNIHRPRGLLKILYREALTHRLFFSCGAPG